MSAEQADNTGVAVREITGTTRVTGLTLADGSTIDCDTVVICTGIRPNTDLARQAGASRFMTKPFSNSEVLEAVRELAAG